MKDLCEYCIVKNDSHCKIRRKGRSKDCPCIVCLLKSICANSCETWEKLWYKSIE